MTDDKGTTIVPQESREEWLPVMTVEQAVIRYQEMQQFVKSVLKDGIDYGTIPGTRDKPTLLKPGAEKFAKFFGLGIEHELVDSIEDWEKGFFNYRYKVIARSLRSGSIIATGEGSCNSKEKKYRIRYVPEFAATDEEKQRVLHRETRTSKKGKAYVMLTILNDDPYSIVNTIQKMAYKRALVAAVLVAANASDYFTQDIEDMAPEVVNGEIVEDKKKVVTKTTSSPRPYSPEQLRQRMQEKAAGYQAGFDDGTRMELHQNIRGATVGNLEMCFAGDPDSEKKRHSVQKYLFDVDSFNDLADGQVMALKQWLNATEDSGGQWAPDPVAVKEAIKVMLQHLVDQGQKALDFND